MTTELESIVPRMRAETGYEADESVASLRPSGFVSLLFGIISPVVVLGKPLLFLPVIAILLGIFAIRRFNGEVAPIGTLPGRLGVVLGFGCVALGLALPAMKSSTLGGQAERFAREYIEAIALGHNEIAMEMRKDYVNRFPKDMSLKAHYQSSPEIREAYDEFNDDGIHSLIRGRGPGAVWTLAAPTRVFYSYRRQHAHLVLTDPLTEKPKIQIFMEYRIDSVGDGQWHIKTVQGYRELIVAPSIL